MKKQFLAVTIAVALTVSAIPFASAAMGEGVAYASTQAVQIDGNSVTFQAYALKDANGNDTNYVKIRDVADALDGTAAQFNVGWDNAVNIETGKPYSTPNGQEGTTPYSGNRAYTKSTSATKINGGEVDLDAITLTDDNGGGYTYYKLRDLGESVGFHVDWSAEKGIIIETTIGAYTPSDSQEAPVGQQGDENNAIVGMNGTLKTQKFEISISEAEVTASVVSNMGVDVETKAGEGKTFLHITFTAKNITDSTENIVNAGFNAYVDGVKVAPSSVVGKIDGVMPLVGAVSAGMEIKGYAVWELPETWTEFQTSYIESSTGVNSEQHFIIYRNDMQD